MEIAGQILNGISAALGGWLIFLLIYQLSLTPFGFRKVKKDYADHDPASRFLILVPAHNEAAVIGDIIHNLSRMDYPRELYDFYIIADNCTDNTAEIARGLGAKVIETRKERPDSPTGKPIALKKALDIIGDYEKQYDLLMIFDADNLMDENMFREVNSQFLDKNRPDFIQCYLGCKNKNGIIAWFDYVSFTLNNRFFHLAKHRLGLNASIGGTGFAMSTSYLKVRGGWTTMSLTEDFEIQVEATLEGRKILWNPITRIYDEKPTRLKASIRQKMRWGQGHWFVALRNFVPAFKALFKGEVRFFEFLSLFTHMFSTSAYVATALQLLITLILYIPSFGIKPNIFGVDPVALIVSAIIFGYSYLALFYIADWMDNKIPFSFKTLPFMLISVGVNSVISVFYQIVGLLRCRQQQNWVKTEHGISAASANDNNKEEKKAS